MIIEQKPEDIKENRRITGKALKIMSSSKKIVNTTQALTIMKRSVEGGQRITPKSSMNRAQKTSTKTNKLYAMRM